MDEDLKYPRLNARIIEAGTEFTVTVFHRAGPKLADATLVADEVVKSVDDGLAVATKFARQLEISDEDVDVQFSLPSLRRAERAEQFKSKKH